jgi:lipopolysaccharide export LptBFGC system permease protein LptF
MRESDVERRGLGVALQKRYATVFLPLVIALFTTPFALSLSRKGKAATIGYAVGLWLVFMGVSGTFDQLGLNGYLSPAFAVWSPLVLFSLLGVYLVSRVRT